MRIVSTLIILCLSSLFSFAQFSTYYTTDITKPVYRVDDMQPQEIRDYNKWKSQGWGDGLCLLHVNSERAHSNLVKAPSTIISFIFWGDVDVSDQMPNYIGAKNISIQLINTTPKIISRITFSFAFYKEDGTQVFDTKTGNAYCFLSFSNLKGRTKLKSHKNEALDLFNCYHLLTIENATEKTLFYNNNIVYCRLEGVDITYEDGTTRKDVAFVERNCESIESFLKLSPFLPIMNSYEYASKNGYSLTSSDEVGESIVQMKEEPKEEPKVAPWILEESIKEEPKVEPPILEESKKEEPMPGKEEIFSSAAHMPYFPGGDTALMKYLSSNICYPQSAVDKNVQGKVIVQFVVTKTGKVGEVKVARSVDKDLDREEIRVCKSLPTFSPGRNANGDPVSVWYTLPVTFKLQSIRNKLLYEEREMIAKNLYYLLSNP